MVCKYIPRKLLEVTIDGIASMHPECTDKFLKAIDKCISINKLYGVSLETYATLLTCNKVVCPECREKLKQLIQDYVHSADYESDKYKLSDIRQLNRLRQ